MRVFLISIVSILSLLSYACQSADEEAPPIIPREELIPIIAETLVVEASGKEVAQITQDTLIPQLYNRVLEHYDYNMDDLIQSMQWAQKEPERLHELYTEVLEYLQVLETEAGK